jgi:hypothetical protein
LLYPGVAAANEGAGDPILVGDRDDGSEDERPWFSLIDVVSRESRSSPSGDNHISCTPTDQPDANVGIAYAMVAIMFCDDERMARDKGGHVV